MTKILFKQTKKHTKKDPCLFQECPGISLQTEKPVPATQWPPAEAQRFGRRQLDAQVLALVSTGAVGPLARELGTLVHSSTAKTGKGLILYMV